MADDVERCEHGIRWPHPCDDCEAEALKPHNLIARIETQAQTIATLRADLAKAVDGYAPLLSRLSLYADMTESHGIIADAQSLIKELGHE